MTNLRCVALLADRTAEMGVSGQLSSSASVLGSTRSCRPWMCRGILGVPKAQGLELSPATSLGNPATMPRKQTTHLEVSGYYDQPQLSSECPEAPQKQESFCQHRSGIRRSCLLPRPQTPTLDSPVSPGVSRALYHGKLRAHCFPHICLGLLSLGALGPLQLTAFPCR